MNESVEAHLIITGHRPPKLSGYGKHADERHTTLAEAVLTREQSTIVITGVAQGWDQAAAQERYEQHPNSSARIVYTTPYDARDPDFTRELAAQALNERNRHVLRLLKDNITAGGNSLIAALPNGEAGGTRSRKHKRTATTLSEPHQHTRETQPPVKRAAPLLITLMLLTSGMTHAQGNVAPFLNPHTITSLLLLFTPGLIALQVMRLHLARQLQRRYNKKYARDRAPNVQPPVVQFDIGRLGVLSMVFGFTILGALTANELSTHYFGGAWHIEYLNTPDVPMHFNIVPGFLLHTAMSIIIALTVSLTLFVVDHYTTVFPETKLTKEAHYWSHYNPKKNMVHIFQKNGEDFLGPLAEVTPESDVLLLENALHTSPASEEVNIIARLVMLQRADAARIEIIDPERPHETLVLNTYDEDGEEA